MIQGGSRLNKDIPPYIIVGREPARYSGINIVGLRRRGFSNETINNIHNTYRLLYNSGYNVSDAVKHIKEEIPQCPEVDSIINFIENVSKRGIIG